VGAGQGSRALIRDGHLGGFVGASLQDASELVLRNTSIDAAVSAIRASNSRILIRSQTIDGSLQIRRKSLLELDGVTQASLGMDPNSFGGDSLLETENNTTILGVLLGTFSNGLFAGGNIGNLSCEGGSDAFCDGVAPTNAGSTGCPLCP